MTTPQASDAAEQIVQSVMAKYVDKRVAYYRDTSLLSKLLQKDHLIFALKGASTVEEWVIEALAAHESSSEETVMGNAWQQILTDLSQSVGAGDLFVEKAGTLWVIEMKSQTNTLNSTALAQTLRVLKTKVIEQSRVHAPGRRGVRPMIGVIRGPASDVDRVFVAASPENRDIDGFQYHYMVGTPFRAWLTGIANPAQLVTDLAETSERVSNARAACRLRLAAEMEAVLAQEGLASNIESVIRLVAGKL